MQLPHVFGVNDLRIVEVDRPRPGLRDALIQVASAGICGSDLGMVALGGIIGPTSEPIPIGHELSGTVIETGAEVTVRKPGERVILNPLRNMVGNGGPEGGFAEFLLIRNIEDQPDALLDMPDSMSFDTGALVEPIAVSLHAVNRSGAKPGDKAAVFGAGMIGLGIVLALRQRGIEDIVVFDLSALRLERALKLGARAAINPRQRSAKDVLGELHGEEMLWGILPAVGTDVFFEASGAPGLIPEIIGLSKMGGRICVSSVIKKPVEVDFMAMLGREITITTSMGYPSELPDAIALLSGTAEQAQAMVSHRFTGPDFLQAFKTAGRPDEAAKVLVQYEAG